MKLKQYKLKNLDSNSYKICWLDGDLNVGAKLTLKDEIEKFEVIEKYDTEISKELLDMNRNPKWYSIWYLI